MTNIRFQVSPIETYVVCTDTQTHKEIRNINICTQNIKVYIKVSVMEIPKFLYNNTNRSSLI